MKQKTYQHYWEKGWAVEEGVFSREEADRIAQVALEVSQQELSSESDDYVVDKSEDGEIAPRKIDRPFLKRSEFQAFVLDERLTGLVAELLGAQPLLVRRSGIYETTPIRLGQTLPPGQFLLSVRPRRPCNYRLGCP